MKWQLVREGPRRQVIIKIAIYIYVYVYRNRHKKNVKLATYEESQDNTYAWTRARSVKPATYEGSPDNSGQSLRKSGREE